MSLRVVIDVRHIRDFGIGTYIRNLLKALGDLDRESHFTLTALPDDVPEFAGLPENFEVLPYLRRDSESMDQFSYPWLVRSCAADVIHVPLNTVPLFLPKPYVVTIHDMSSLLFERHGSNWRENIRLYRFRRGLLRADKVIAVSDATRRDVENLLGISGDRIRLVYSAPDPKFLELSRNVASANGDTLDQDSRRILERYQIDYPFLLYAGRIRPHKNIPRLIEAFAVIRGEMEAHPDYRDLRLLIIGDQITQHPEVRRAVIQTRMQQSVRFLGFVPFETLRVFYAAAVAFVFPSLYEGFGLPPLEAMATGTPVITASVSSLPEVVGDAAMIVNPDNVFDMARGIRDVLLDKQVRQRLITRGHEQVKRFSWRRTAQEVLSVYREVVAAKH
jgi:glycosyltransferase involved in cell wall biosynthesis